MRFFWFAVAGNPQWVAGLLTIAEALSHAAAKRRRIECQLSDKVAELNVVRKPTRYFLFEPARFTWS